MSIVGADTHRGKSMLRETNRPATVVPSSAGTYGEMFDRPVECTPEKVSGLGSFPPARHHHHGALCPMQGGHGDAAQHNLKRR